MKIALTFPGMNGTPIDSGLPKGVPTGGLEGTGVNAIRGFLILFITIAILYAVWKIWQGGWGLITSRGHKEEVKKNREQILFAIMGLLFIFLTFIGVGLLNSLLGVDLFPYLKFK